MSIAFALHYFFRQFEGVHALALPLTHINQLTPPPTCADLNTSRTKWDIIWSCLITVFSCTWFAIHPNIPAPSESYFRIVLSRVGIMVMALIAPELLIMWAMGQWFEARKLAKKYEARGWTQTHGFFAIMGGFMLYDRHKPLRVIQPNELETLFLRGKITFPEITQKELEDRSKSDALAKSFVLIQTGWFVLQCITRGFERLPITELEIVTLAFAVLNLVTYTLWWNKPLNVRCPYHVQIIHGSAGDCEGEFCSKLVHFIQFIRPSRSNGLTESNYRVAATTTAIVAVTFGALHCIAWSFEFPSQEKEILWRTCSVAITCLPVAMVLLGLLVKYLSNYSDRHDDMCGVVARSILIGLATVLIVILPIFYVVSRAVLLIEAFVLLNSLPPGAFRAVQWTTFIPHV